MLDGIGVDRHLVDLEEFWTLELPGKYGAVKRPTGGRRTQVGMSRTFDDRELQSAARTDILGCHQFYN